MTDSLPDCPPMFEAAELKLSTFISSQNYPDTIYWVTSADLLIDAKRHFWIRLRPEAKEHAALKYAEGIDNKLGIELRVICATDRETFASVFIPKSDVDAQYHLIGSALKLTCPMKRHSTSVVRNRLKWLFLCWWRRQVNVQELFE